jgi:hypothetical protein
MRDPDLVVRAQRAAAELERAWDRWRTMNGLGTDPLPPVSSYVGYSLEEPWGQPRVVFGIDAREAEQLAALLDRYDFAGPIYASVAALPGARSGENANGRPGDADRGRAAGRVHVPSQAQAGAASRETASREQASRETASRETASREPASREQASLEPASREQASREASPREASPREVSPQEAQEASPRGISPRERSLREAAQRETARREAAEPDPPEALRPPLEPPGRRDKGEPRSKAGALQPEADYAGPAAREGQGTGSGQPGLVSFRPRREPASGRDEGQDPEPIPDEPDGPADADQAGATWTRAGRVPGGHTLPRQKRPGGAAKPSSGRQEGKDRAGLEAMAAELAGWAAGELPGQASHRCAQGPRGWQDRHQPG